jgi:2-polyprenyl-3-methyl-5-hydroxy-6-metoxy-1,4-benzoquinol methylase
MLIESPCDLCGSTEYSVLFPGTISPGEKDNSAYFSSSRSHSGHLPIVKCRVCSLVRTNPRDDVYELKLIYEQLQDAAYEAEAANRQRTAGSNFAWVRRFYPGPGRLLDVGCATGIFLGQVRQSGWSVTGLEPSKWAAVQAAGRLAGVEIFNETVENADFPANSFDVITLWDVLEHLSSPAQTLAQLSRWLAPSGWILLNLPNISSWPARFMGSHWVLFLREHLWYFSPLTINKCLEKSGFRPVSTHPNQVWFTLGTILDRASQSHRPAVEYLTQLLSRNPHIAGLNFRFPIGEMQVAAQKV